VKPVREPDDRNGHVRFDERGGETERWASRRERPERAPARVQAPPALYVTAPFFDSTSNQVLVDLLALDLRTYIAEPDRGRRRWKKKATARDAVYANRRRIHGGRGLALLRQRSERLERPNAHLYETGGLRRIHLRGHTNILKRLLVHVSGFNLGLFMRTLFGIGTPRSLQGHLMAALTDVGALLTHAVVYWRAHDAIPRPFARVHEALSFRAVTLRLLRRSPLTSGWQRSFASNRLERPVTR
jgi:hypothetical protein